MRRLIICGLDTIQASKVASDNAAAAGREQYRVDGPQGRTPLLHHRHCEDWPRNGVIGKAGQWCHVHLQHSYQKGMSTLYLWDMI